MTKLKSGDPSRFYGAGVPALASKLCREELTYARDTKLDLVDAHLKSNYAYFGSLDKTLAGFFILDDRGDDYTLLDLREKNGQVHLLEHEEMTLRPIFDSLAAYAKWRSADDARRGDRTPRPRAPKARSTCKPDTAQLWSRYRWLVWLLAQPKLVDDDEAISTAREKLTSLYGSGLKKADAAYAKERPQLARDAHLAIYWLLHFTCLGNDAERDRVALAVEGSKNDLLRAFLAKFGAMGSDGTIAVLPAFRKRRSRLIFQLASERGKDPFPLLLKAFEVDPIDRGLDKAVAVWAHARTDADRQRVRACVGAASMKGPGADYLRLELAVLDGKPRKADWLLEHDPYHTRFLELVLAAGADGAIERRLADARKAEVLLEGITAAADKARDEATIDGLDRAIAPSLKALAAAPAVAREIAARRIIARAEAFPNGAIVRAFEMLRKSKEPDGAERTARLAHAAMRMSWYGLVDAAATHAKKGDADAIDLLWALLAYDERTCNQDHAGTVKERAIEGLGGRLADRFGSLIALIGRPGYAELESALLDQPLSPSDRSSILKRLSNEQKDALAYALTGLPPSKVEYNDEARDVIEAILSPERHAAVVRALRGSGDAKRAERYAGMIDYFAGDDSPVTKILDCEKAAAQARAAAARR